MKRTLIHITDKQYEKLRREAFEKKVSMSFIYREMIDQKYGKKKAGDLNE